MSFGLSRDELRLDGGAADFWLLTSKSRRDFEIGIRIPLGARSPDVLWLVTRRGAALAVAGIGLGLAGALAATRVLASLLYARAILASGS